MNSKDMAILAAKAMNSKKGLDIKIIKIRDLTVITDYFVIASGTSTTQVKALAEEVEYQFEKQIELQPLRKEGFDSKNWVILDYANIIVHVFYPESREAYDLERLWADGELVEIDLDEEIEE